ncbi:uncharacterized protein LOC132262852 [Phlebotomus argentipes]|uniref:uncharacterized protein LOC132262852 n=1 Tax=Phlebotomus argentipes TaxID=94469 RepID=UPI002892E899|nr:uncharacterized protein LOC132262852 [Phlebotomus argentipes]
MNVRLVLILLHFFAASRAFSVHDNAARELGDFSVEDSQNEIDIDSEDEKQFSVSFLNVNFNCKNIIIETEFNLLMLQENHLYVINTNDSESSLAKLATLGDFAAPPLDAKASFWTDDKIIIVLAFPTHYNVYKVALDRSGANFLPPIQKISIIEEIPVKIALYHRREELFCLLVTKISEYRGILRLFTWHLMHFKEVVHQYVSGMTNVLHTNWHDNERAAIATVHRGREKVEIHLLDGYNLSQFQTLHAHGQFVRFVKTSDNSSLLICSLSHHCDIYQWMERRFNHWRRVNLSGDFHDFHTGHNVIIYRFNHTLFVSNRVDLMPIRSINCTTARIYLHKVHDSATIWAVSVFLEPPHTRLNFIKITQVGGNEDSEQPSGRHLDEIQSFTRFLGCANQLKRQFGAIYGSITKMSALNQLILRQDRPVELSGKLTVSNVTRVRENVTIELAKVPMNISQTPTELLKNVAHLNAHKLKLETNSGSSLENSNRLRRDDGNQTRTNGEKLTSINAERIRVRNLRTNSDKWTKVLLKRSSSAQNVTITALKSLRVANAYVSGTVNGIHMEQVLHNSSHSLLQNKTIHNASYKNLIVKNSINSIHIDDFLGQFAKGRSLHSSGLHVDQVIVEKIQGMDFDSFYHSLFLRNSSREIDGNLTFHNVTTVKDAKAETINSKATDNLVSLHTNQIINSTIRINQFRVEHFEVDTVNGIEFSEKNLALIGKDNHLEGPIQLYDLYARDLVLSEGDEESPDRIIGTHIDDLSQVYMGQVTLKGNLHVGTLRVASKNNFFVDQPFNLSSLGDFWDVRTNQDFSGNVIFSGNITTPQLQVDFVNQHAARDFLTTRQERVGNITLFLTSAHVAGSVEMDESGQTLANIVSESVVRVNERTVVKGVKNFTGRIHVGNLITTHLNDDLIAKVVLRNFSRMEFPSPKHFSHLHLAENLIVGAKNVNINSVLASDLRELIESCVMIDEAQNITFVQANEIQSRDIEVEKLNTVPFSKSISDIEKMKIHVEIQGNVTFRRNARLSYVNGVNLEAFLPLVAHKSKALQVGGTKNFTGDVKILKEFTAGAINGHSVENWLRNALVNGTNQTVKEKWTVGHLKAPKINVDTINGVRVKHLMDSEGSVHFDEDLHVEEMTVNGGDVFGRIDIDFDQIVELLKMPNIRAWSELRVERDAHWPLIGSLSPLTEILTNALHAHEEQEIGGEVHFTSASVDNLTARMRLNDVSVETLSRDSVRRTSSSQKITGHKHFLQPIGVRNLIAKDYLNVPIINNIDILKLNATMLRRSEKSICIEDSWTFRNILKVNDLMVHKRINNVLPEDLATALERHDKYLPATFFNNLTIVGNLTVTFVDRMPLDHLINERVKKRAEKNQDLKGLITFKDVILADYADVYSINGIQINSLFLKRASHVQDVTGEKVCLGNLRLLGPSSVSYLNSRDIVEMHHNSLFLNKDHSVDDYGFERVHLKNALKVKESLNGIHLDTINYMGNSSHKMKDIEEEIQRIIQNIPDGSTFVVAKKKRFVYFDYVNSTASMAGLSPRVVRSVNIDVDFGGVNLTEWLCSRRYSVKMLEDSNMVIRRVESVSKGSQRAWSGVEMAAGNHVQNCISRLETGENTTITFTVRHAGRVAKIEKIYQGGLSYMAFLKIKTTSNGVLAIVATIRGNVTRIQLERVNRDTPAVSTLHTISLSAENTSIHVMKAKEHVHLIVGVPKNTLDNSILVYKLTKNATEFSHSHSIGGNYGMIRCNDALGMIILGNRGSHFVNIYKLDDESGEFKLFQSIKLQSTPRLLNTFAVAENQFFVITLENDNFLIYKYNYIEGWVLICVNQYPNIESVTPFSLANEGYLLAIAADSARVIALFTQTED